MSRQTFVLIGAGSTVFTPGLLRDLARSPLSDDLGVRLVDVDAQAAQTMAAVGRRIAQHYGSGLTVEAYVDRREALAGARFVTTTIAVGSAPGWLADLQIPARHGVEQTVGDSVGPGGVLRALRHIPELIAIAEDVADVAPQAWLVNYTNPLTANVRAITKHTGVSAIGLCHGTMHTKAALAAALGLDPGDVHAVFAGLNHLCWLLEISSGGIDLYPRLAELIRERRGDRRAESSRSEGVHAPVSGDLFDMFGRYPAPGDRHVSEFFAGYLERLPADEGGALAWGLQGGQDMTFEYIAEKHDLWDDLRAQASGEAPVSVADNQEAERMVSIAEALITGRDQLELAVNLPNGGQIPNLPTAAVVEIPAVVGAAGIVGLAVGPLPAGIAAVLTARANQQEITVQAAVSSDRRLALQALVLDPLVPDSATARSILDDAVSSEPALKRFAS